VAGMETQCRFVIHMQGIVRCIHGMASATVAKSLCYICESEFDGKIPRYATDGISCNCEREHDMALVELSSNSRVLILLT
jgi:hypothetical protein